VWPAFSARNSHFTFCKASLLDQPNGLSSNSTPCTGRLATRARGAIPISIFVFRARRHCLSDQSIHVSRLLSGPVKLKMQCGYRVYVQALKETGAKETGRLVQTCFTCHGISHKQTEKHFGMRVIRCHFDGLNRHHSDPWVFQLAGDQFRQIPLDLIGDPKASVGCG
jgi:hypothetical protein